MIRRLVLLTAMVLAAAVPAAAAPVPFTVPCVDDVMDFYGNPLGADLVIFAGGNQWFVMPALMRAFHQANPGIGPVFYETLPPGLLAEQMRNGAIKVGSMELTVRPDVYLSGKRRMETMRRSGLVDAPVTYATNVLAVMVKSGNPQKITSLRDLGRPNVRIAMPNPKTEGIARQIELAYRKAGGVALDRTIMVAKATAGTTVFTHIHHRETPMWILDARVDAGPVWISEALYQERIHSGIEAVRLPADQNVEAIYMGAVVHAAAHAAAARAFVQFLATPTAQSIYRSYGFGPPPTGRNSR
jgi:molybdate transport system substrate-binding protein